MYNHIYIMVGTSILTNAIDWNYAMKKTNRPFLTAIENLMNKSSEYPSEAQNEIIKKHIHVFTTGYYKCHYKERDYWKENVNLDYNPDASAEINSYLTLLAQRNFDPNSIKITFITTDTIAANYCAGLLVDFFMSYLEIDHSLITVEKVQGLQVHNSKEFLEEGFQSLVGIFKPLMTGRRTEKPVINITGGYKGVVPVVTIIGQLLDIPIVYQYEDSLELIEVLPLPISFDWTLVEVYQYYFNYVKNNKLSEGSISDTSAKLFKSKMVEPGFFYPKDSKGSYAISYLGMMLQQYIDYKYPLAKPAFATIMEFLLYEYYTIKVEKDLDVLSVSRGFNINETEYDILINTPSGKIIGEVKSFKSIVGRYVQKLVNQCLRQVDNLIDATEYHLYIYMTGELANWNEANRNLHSVAKAILESNPDIRAFKAFGISIPIEINAASNNPNVYVENIKRKVTMDYNTWEEGETEMYGNPYLLMKEIFYKKNR